MIIRQGIVNVQDRLIRCPSHVIPVDLFVHFLFCLWEYIHFKGIRIEWMDTKKVYQVIQGEERELG